MPPLLLLAACEKVIVDDSRNASLIVLIENITAEFPEGTVILVNTITPQTRNVYTIWKRRPEESLGQNYRHVTEIVAASKDIPTVKITGDFEFKGTLHKVNHSVAGFPIGTEGALKATV